jgi:V8-like Glu-specific endopeptidase
MGKGSELQPTVHRTYISKSPTDNQFQIQSNVVGGQSGTPIIDKNHRLVGVVWGSHRGTEVAYGCNIKHLKEMYDKYKARK